MAFTDDATRFYTVDLTTRVGALGAARLGSNGCFIFTAMAVLGGLLMGSAAGFTTPDGIAAMAGVAVEAVIALIAGLRLRTGKGAFWGMAAAALLALEMVAKLVALSLGGLILSAVVMVCIIQGIRGALALRGNTFFEDDASAVFE